MESLPLFGSPLVTALARSHFTTPSGLSIPGVLARTFHAIEEKGLDIEGIFRKSGSTAIVNALQAQFEQNPNPFLVNFPSSVSTHSLAGLFKRYLQKLPEPVIPRKYQPLFLEIFDEEKYTTETLKRRLKELCKTLPHEHLHMLQFLMEVTDTVQKFQAENQMSIESLAIIFAPTCVRIDGVSQLMPTATLYPSTQPYRTMRKQQKPVLRKARKLLFHALGGKKSYDHRYDTHLLYRPNDLLQLGLIKESNTWVRIFEFMMTYPEVFTTLTNPLKSQKYRQQQSMTSAGSTDMETEPCSSSPPPPPPPPHESPIKSMYPSFSQQEKKMLLDFKQLELTDTTDLLQTFKNFDFGLNRSQSTKQQDFFHSKGEEKFDFSLDHGIKQEENTNKRASVGNMQHLPSQSKYTETLLNWKSREEVNRHVIIPQVVIKRSSTTKETRPLSPQPSDWVKAISSGLFEPMEKIKPSRQPLFIHIENPLHP